MDSKDRQPERDEGDRPDETGDEGTRGPGRYEIPDEVEDLGIDGAEIQETREGGTQDPREAAEEGLSYSPPTDPAVRPATDEESTTQMAAGFAHSVEEAPASAHDLPDRVARGDLQLETNVREALRDNSETSHLTDIDVDVEAGMVTLQGTVPTRADLAMAHEIVRHLDGVARVRLQLAVAG